MRSHFLRGTGHRRAAFTWFAAALGMLLVTHARADSTSVAIPIDRPATGEVEFLERNLSGPRLGVTYRPEDADHPEVGRFVSQFGWHFERQVVPHGGGPQFIMQFVPLVAGVEYGKFLPSASLGLGVRFPSGYEFGIGPSVTTKGSDYESAKLRSALIVAVGRSFDYGGVSIPLNVAVATNQDGARVSLIVGYAIQHTERSLSHP